MPSAGTECRENQWQNQLIHTKQPCLKFWSFLQNLINLFSCFTEGFDNLFKDAGRAMYPSSFKALGPGLGLSTAVSDPTVRTREGLNSPFVNAGKVLVWLSSLWKAPLWSKEGWSYRCPQAGIRDSSSCREGWPQCCVPGVTYGPSLGLLSRTVLAAHGNHHLKTCFNVMPFSQEQRIRSGFLSSCHKRYF